MKKTVMFSRVTLADGRCFDGAVELQYLPRDEDGDQGWHAHIRDPVNPCPVVISARIVDLIEPLEEVIFEKRDKEWRREEDWRHSDALAAADDQGKAGVMA